MPKIPASAIGVVKKLTTQGELLANTLQRSNTDEALRGLTLNLPVSSFTDRAPHTIVSVVRKSPNDRMLVLRDQEGNLKSIDMSRDYLNALVGAHGTKTYTETFSTMKNLEKKHMAGKSLDIREARRAAGPEDDKWFKQWNTAQAQKVHNIDPALVQDYVYARRPELDAELLYMPRKYADILSKRGHVEILTDGPNPQGVLDKTREHAAGERRRYQKYKEERDTAPKLASDLSEEEMMENFANSTLGKQPEKTTQEVLHSYWAQFGITPDKIGTKEAKKIMDDFVLQQKPFTPYDKMLEANFGGGKGRSSTTLRTKSRSAHDTNFDDPIGLGDILKYSKADPTISPVGVISQEEREVIELMERERFEAEKQARLKGLNNAFKPWKTKGFE